MKLIRQIVPLVAILTAGACKDLEVPNYNAQGLSELQNGANLQGIGAAAVGLLATTRDFETSFLSSYTSVTGEFGRESLELDPSNPAHPTERLDAIGNLEPGNAGFTTGYRLMKQANTLIAALGSATGMTDAQKDGVRGFAKTLQAMTLMRLLVAFDATGLPIDVDIKTTDPIAPLATKPQVQARIAQLLDEGKTSLLAGGSAFSFTFPAGFVGQTSGPALNTPAQFLKFNRALRARIAAYQATATNTPTPADFAPYAAALTAITESFIDPLASMRFGAYDTYSTASGDRQNPLFDPTCRQLFAIPGLEAAAQVNSVGGAIDNRFTTKVRRLIDLPPPNNVASKTNHTYIVTACFLPLYPAADSPVPIIRNEELFLLRAEALWFTGNKAGAVADIDVVRNRAGLGPSSTATPTPLTAASSDDTFITELLYNRHFSLMFEGGHRWADTRRFGRLGTLPRALPRSATLPDTKIFNNLPLPQTECLPRGNPAAACTAPAPIP
jgi:starch-binding outer membrane protein, SusD/RagB family